MWWKLMKIANIDRQSLCIFWTTWEISIKFWGKLWLMIILQVTIKQGSTVLEDTFFKKPQGRSNCPPPSSPFRVINVSGSVTEKNKKDIHKLFKDNQLNITIQCNLKIVNYLNVTFNLSNATTYWPFWKPNKEITHIHKESNHPPSILGQIPQSIKSGLSKHSPNEKIFKESAQIY